MTDQPQLQKFLDHVAAGRGGTVTEYRPISGGYSRLSALATVRWADGSEESFVLRSDPPPDTGVFCSSQVTASGPASISAAARSMSMSPWDSDCR